MATPMVTAAAAYLREHFPNATAAVIRKYLAQCVDGGDIKWVFAAPFRSEEMHGAGVLDFARIVACTQKPSSFPL